MPNDRNAGRKPIFSNEDLLDVKKRHAAGESMGRLAEEYGVSRQALYKRIKESSLRPVRIDYVIEDSTIAEIDVDTKSHEIAVVNYAVELSRLPFGFNKAPSWQDFCAFLEDEYLKQLGVSEPGSFLITAGGGTFGVRELEHLQIDDNDIEKLPIFKFSKKDILFTRTDTDGYQMKALSGDRRYFVKSQAVIAGVAMRDWAVEVIASDIARQLGIPCVEQHSCRCVFGKKTYDAVFSDNFELDGYTFLSFESLIAAKGLSTMESSFIKLDAIGKMKWCAKQLSEIGHISYEDSLKYMLDLAVLDCLIGNVDRHTRNFGLFYNSLRSEYSIPLVFDNGMGLFEHDHDRDSYTSFDEAMHSVYVSPYGEDPFDMLCMLDSEFHLKQVYLGVDRIEYPDILMTPHALEYERRMQGLWQKFV